MSDKRMQIPAKPHGRRFKKTKDCDGIIEEFSIFASPVLHEVSAKL